MAPYMNFGRFGGQSTLLDGLIEWWGLQEASGNRTGDHAGLVLEDNNTVSSGVGFVGSNAAYFNGDNSEFLEIAAADDSNFDFGTGDFAFNAWVYESDVNTNVGPERLFDKRTFERQEGVALAYTHSGGNTRIFGLGESSIEDSSGQSAWSTTGLDASTKTWHMLTCNFDRDGNWEVFTDGTSDATLSISSTSDSINTSARLCLGAENAQANFWDGRMEQVAFWSRILTTDEIDELYNGGAGIRYADL